MASKPEVVRITFKELESSVQEKEETTKEFDRNNPDDGRKKRQKRPAQGIYRPPRRQRPVEEQVGSYQGESWEEDGDVPSSDSKENSSEREIEDVSKNLSKLSIPKSKSDSKKPRSKRPEIQRYVPKGKILEQQSKDKEDDSGEAEQNEELSPRKIDLKPELQELKVTVVNEGISPAKNQHQSKGAKNESKPPTGPHNPLDRTESACSPKLKHDSTNLARDRNVHGQHDKTRSQRDSNFYGNRSKLNRKDEDLGRGTDSAESHKGQRTEYRGQGDGKNRQFDKNRNTEQRRQDASKESKSNVHNTDKHDHSVSRQGDQEKPRSSRRNDYPKPQRQPTDRRERRADTGKTTAEKKTEEEGTEEPIIKDIIPTMVFERRSNNSPTNSDSCKQVLNSSGNGNNGNSKGPSKRYSLSAMRRPRAGSVSSDVSNASDISIDEETTNRILDWSEEVEREMAEHVHDETRKLQTFLDQKGDLNDWDGAIETVDKARQVLERGHIMQRSMEDDRLYRSHGDNAYGHSKNKEDKNISAGHKEFDNGFRQRRNSDGSRSRRREKRRKGSSNGRRSRDSSVSSAHSVRSYHGDEDMYGTDTWPRRRNRRKGSNTSMKESHSREILNDPSSLNLKVTFARDEKRQVRMNDGDAPKGRGRGRGRGQREDRENFNRGRSFESKDQMSSGRVFDRNQLRDHEAREYEEKIPRGYQSQREDRRRQNSGDSKESYGPYEARGKKDSNRRQYQRDNDEYRRDRGMQEKRPESTAHGGGIIKLPANVDTSDSNYPVRQNIESHDMSHRQDKGRASFRDPQNTSGQRMLYDPKNPNKMIAVVIPNAPGTSPTSQLKFKDPSGQESPQSPHQHPMIPSAGFPPMPPFRGYPPPFYPGFDPRFPEAMYGGPPMPGYYYGYPSVYRDNALYQDEVPSRDYPDEAEHVQPGRSRAQCRMMAEHMFQEALHMEAQLTALVSRRLSNEGSQSLFRLRHDLLLKLEQITLLDPDVSNKHSVEQLLWKSVFYQVIEMFRRQLPDNKEDEEKDPVFYQEIRTNMAKVLDEGTSFFDKFLQKLQQKYNFVVDDFLDTNTSAPENQSRSVRLALLSTQRTMINLGDIARYREQYYSSSGKVNYGRARSWYTKAQQLAPKNGRPYNQLAILAMKTRRKLDAVYYYMRSIAASNPFLTARESLISLFDEARKKVLAVERKKEEEKEKINKLKQHKQQHGQRIEIWVSPDGTSSEGQTDLGDVEDLSKLDAVELNKRFNLSFLNVHGKLFTKIARESFPECCGQMLREFQALLKHGALGPTRLIQLMAINMFAIENTALKDPTMPEDFRSELQEHAVQLGLDMFGILLDRCGVELNKHLASSDYPSHMFSRELEELVPGVKKWIDWMTANLSLWNPPPSLRDTALGPKVDVWKVTATFVNILKDMDISHVKLYEDKIEGCEPVIVFEDTMLSGFVPLLSAPIKTAYVHSTVDKDIAKDCLRIQVLQNFGDYLCGVEPPMLEYDVVNKEYYSVTPSTDYSEDAHGDLPSDSDEDAAVIIESEEEMFEGAEGDDHVRQLKQKKEELRKKKEQQIKEKENIQKLIEKDRHRCIELEIHPIFLVPDTNCFIDHFSEMKQLILSKKYTIVVPLIVINELDGLAKGSKEGQYDSKEHAQKVSERSRQTVILLEEEFEKKNSHLKAQTSKGNILETISFRSEEGDNSGGNNDDTILSCCLHYCKDKAREFMPKEKDAPVHLYREVVLLTDDRNLRLKAHTCNVPVKDVASFLKWSKVT